MPEQVRWWRATRGRASLLAFVLALGCGRLHFERSESTSLCAVRCMDASVEPNDAAPPDDAGATEADGGAVDAGRADAAPTEDAAIDGGRPEPPSLVGYWTFDETSGAVALDRSASGAHARIVGAASGWVADGRYGGALDATDRVAVVDDLAALSRITSAQALTVTAWIRITGSAGMYRAIATRHKSSDGYFEHLGMYLVSDRTQGMLDSSIADNDGTTCGAAAAVYGRWMHVAMTWNGSELTVYEDGTERCRVGTVGLVLQTDMTPLGLGANNNGGVWDEHLGGDLDEVALYDRALTSAEVMRIAQGIERVVR